MTFDHRKPTETGKGGKITFPDTRKRTIVIGAGEYSPASGAAGIRTKPQGVIARFDPTVGIKAVMEASELSVHSFFEPTNPTGVTATATGDTTVDIGATVDDGGNDGVEIHMSTTQGSGYALEATVEESAFPVEITGLTGDTTYYFVLRSFLYDGEKIDAAFTAEVSATTGAGGAAPSAPAQPTIAEISRTATEMTLEATWGDVADETSYEWTAGSDDGTTWSDSATGLAAGTTSVQFVAARTNADHTGFFCVKACNASGCSANSCNGFTVAGNLTAPSSLSAVNPSGDDVDLDWTDMSGATVADVTAIERRLVGGSYSEIDTVPFGTTHYDDNGLADGNYEYRVRARDTDTGNTSPYSSSDSVAIGTGGGGGSEHPNEPLGFTQIAGVDFTNGFTAQVGQCNRIGTSGNLTIVTGDGTTPSGDGAVARQRFPDGENDGAASGRRFDIWGPSISESGSHQYDDIYISFWMKIEGSDYQNQTNGTKVFYIAYGKTNRLNQGYLSLRGQGSQTIMSGPIPMRWRNTVEYGGSDYHGGSVPVGEWVQIEYRFKVNTDGVANGIIQTWVNGSQVINVSNATFLNSGAGATESFWHCQFTPVYGGNDGDIRTRDDFWRYDEVYISAVV